MKLSDIFFSKSRQNGTDIVKSHFVTIFNRLEAIIDGNPSMLKDNISLNMLSRVVGTNRTYLSTAIKLMKNCSFSEYIAEKRVNYSLILIDSFVLDRDSSYINIDNLSDLSGFGSRRSFVNYFKKFIGVYPSQYIRKREISIAK